MNENLSIENFFKLMDLAEHHIEAEMQKLHENLTKLSEMLKEESKNVEKLANFFDYQSSTGFELKSFMTSSKISRKIKFFLRKVANLENLLIKKAQKVLKNYSSEDLKRLEDVFNESDINIRSGARRNYIKTLRELFAVSNAEIFQSKQFAKILKEQKNSIPLASDIKS